MIHRHLFPALFAILATAGLADAQYTNGQNATIVLGQFNFSSDTASVSQSTFGLTAAMAVDAKSGKIFVADTANNRVLRFPASAASSNGAAAEAVFGQSTFTTSTSGAANLSTPRGITLDSSGNLWVADSGNNRVVKFTSAVTGDSTATPFLYLGQPNPTSTTETTSQLGMNNPGGVALDASGNLFVADTGNNRVLRFTGASSLTTGAGATSVLGQTNWLAGNATLSAGGFTLPAGLLIDSSSNLWVADSGNNRVLRFASSNGLQTGASASGVLGQGNFTTSVATTTQNSLRSPTGLAIDPTGRLYVADSANNRVVTFDSAASLANGANATFVFGQGNFTTSATGLSAGTFNLPQGVGYIPSTNQLFVADSTNARLLGFTRTLGRGIASMRPNAPKVRAGLAKDFLITITGSAAADSYRITITPAAATTPVAKFKFYVDGKQVTAAVTNGNYVTPVLTPTGAGSTFQIAGIVQTKTTAKNRLNYNVKVVSTTSSASSSSRNFAITVTQPPK